MENGKNLTYSQPLKSKKLKNAQGAVSNKYTEAKSRKRSDWHRTEIGKIRRNQAKDLRTTLVPRLTEKDRAARRSIEKKSLAKKETGHKVDYIFTDLLGTCEI